MARCDGSGSRFLFIGLVKANFQWEMIMDDLLSEPLRSLLITRASVIIATFVSALSGIPKSIRRPYLEHALHLSA